MSQWFWKKLASAATWIATLAFFVLLVFAANIEIKDLDLWLHLATGRHINAHHLIPLNDILSCTIAGKPWINHEWLFQVVIFNIFDRFGVDGLHTLQVVVVGLTFVLLFALGYRRQFHVIQLLMLIVVLMLFQLRLTLRPEIFSLFFFVFYIFILTFHLTSPLTLLLLFFVQVLWVNMHGFFIFSPMLIIFVLIGEWTKRIIRLPFEWNGVSRLTKEEEVSLLKILLVVVLACLFNPHFLEGALYPFRVLSSLGDSKVFFDQIIELQRPITENNLWSMKEYPELKILIGISFLSFLLNFRRLDISLLFLWVAMLFFALGAVRNVVYFAFIAYLTTMANLNAEFWKDYFSVTAKNQWMRFFCVIFLSIGITLWIGQTLEKLSLHGYYDFLNNKRKSEYGGISLNNFPFKAVDFLEQNEIKGNFFNDFNSGAYLLGRTHPNIKVFIDGRTEMYGGKFFTLYNKIQSGDKRLFDVMAQKFNLTGAFINATKVPVPPKLFRKLYQDPQWKLVYFDYDGAVFLKDVLANRAWIKSYAIDLSDWKVQAADLMSLGATPVIPYQNIHRAYALYYLDFNDKALQEVEEALKISPNYDEAYYLKGRILYDREDYAQALEYFRKAKVLKSSDIEARFGLARCFYKLGNLALAGEQVDKILSVQPRNSNALFLLGLIYAKQQMYADAVTIALKAHKISPEETEGPMELADEFLGQKQFENAQKIYEMVLESDRYHAKARKGILEATSHKK